MLHILQYISHGPDFFCSFDTKALHRPPNPSSFHKKFFGGGSLFFYPFIIAMYARNDSTVCGHLANHYSQATLGNKHTAFSSLTDAAYGSAFCRR
jgi:hypothetical protein